MKTIIIQNMVAHAQNLCFFIKIAPFGKSPEKPGTSGSRKTGEIRRKIRYLHPGSGSSVISMIAEMKIKIKYFL